MTTKTHSISETMQQEAKVCATVAEDITEEALTGEACEKEANEAEAKVWKQKSEGLLEAAAIESASSADQTTPVQK